jgi:hypothetical protein
MGPMSSGLLMLLQDRIVLEEKAREEKVQVMT